MRAIITDMLRQDLCRAPREQVDLSATYAMKKGFAVFGQLANATRSRLASMAGPNRNLLKDSYSVPTILWLGLSFTPRF